MASDATTPGKYSYTYDRANQLTHVTDNSGTPYTTNDSYDAAGRMVARIGGNFAISAFAYDAAGQMTDVLHMKTFNLANQRLTYTYDRVGNRKTLLELDGSRTTWTYDATYRLTNEDRSGTSPHNTTHTYDPVGNRTQENAGGSVTNFQYDAANQLVQREDPEENIYEFSYDQAGNMTTYDSGTSPTTRQYTWDNDNRLVKVEPYGGTPTTMTYNADGLRVGVHGNLGGNIKYVWDGQNVLHEMDGSTPVAAYTYKPDMYGDLLARRYITTTMFYNYDALGSTIGLTDDAKNLVDTYIYKAYGELIAETGGNYNPYRWVGRYGYQFDNQLSLNFNQYSIRQRHYGPLVAAWLSEDLMLQNVIQLSFPAFVQLAESSGFYRYLHNQPTNLVDPPGLILPIIGGAGALALWCWVTPPCGSIGLLPEK
jgi:RHS repeat-associated protein